MRPDVELRPDYRTTTAHAGADDCHAEVLVVEVGGERHGFLVGDVEMIAQAVPITPACWRDSAIEGVITYRGRDVPVVDCRVRLGIPAKPLEHTDHLVIATAAGRPVAIRVDRAVCITTLEVSPLGGDEYGTAPSRGIVGVAHTADGPLFVHDLVVAFREAASVPEPRA